jgi:hypothetical protein
VLFTKEIDQDKVENDCNNERNKNRRIGQVFMKEYTINYIVNNYYDQNSDDALLLFHG